MKREIFAVLLMTAFTWGITSCDKGSTFIGADITEPIDPSRELEVEVINYDASFKTRTKELYTVEQSVDGSAIVYETVSGKKEEIERHDFTEDLDLNVKFSVPEKVYVQTENDLKDVSMIEASHSQASITTSDTKYNIKKQRSNLKYTFLFNKNEVVDATPLYESLSREGKLLPYSDIHTIRFKDFTSVKDEKLSNTDSVVYKVELLFDVDVMPKESELRAESDVETHTVEVPYYRIRKISAPDASTSDVIKGDYREISVTITFAQQDPITETIKIPCVVQAPDPKMIYSANASYHTTSKGWEVISETEKIDGSWTITNRISQYVSTASNTLNPFNNVYVINDAKAVYNNHGVRLEFPYGSWDISEAGTTVGDPVVQGDYNMYSYLNNIDYMYRIPSDSKNGTSRAEAEIYVERPIEKIIPQEWGTILGAAVTAVPSDDLGDNVNIAKKCLTIRTDKGAVAVVFDWSNSVCSVNQVLGSYFVSGNFDASYNSGYWTTGINNNGYEMSKWAPAQAKDLTDRIAYYNQGKCVRNVRYETLNLWNWANGQSTKVSGYTCTVDNKGILTVVYNGKRVLQLR